MTDAVSAGAFSQRDDDDGFLDERIEFAIAIGVVVFMMAFGAWLMFPEESSSALQSAVVAVDEAASDYSVDLSTSPDTSVAPISTESVQEPFVAPTEDLREVIVEPLPTAEETTPIVQAVVEETVVQDPVVQELVVEQPVVEETIVEEIVVVAPEPVAEAEAQLLQRAMSDVQFITGSAVLTQPSLVILDDIFDLMNSRPNSALRIIGYTDSQGDNDANGRLSFARAEACRDYLLERGLKIDRVNAAGFGERNPIGDNSTAEGRRLNRRVEFELVPIGR